MSSSLYLTSRRNDSILPITRPSPGEKKWKEKSGGTEYIHTHTQSSPLLPDPRVLRKKAGKRSILLVSAACDSVATAGSYTLSSLSVGCWSGCGQWALAPGQQIFSGSIFISRRPLDCWTRRCGWRPNAKLSPPEGHLHECASPVVSNLN